MIRPDPVLVARGIHKSFLGVPVLEDVEVALRPGEVHGLVGENGAGKSTLMKIIAGVHPRDRGEIWLDGQPVEFHHPAEAMRAGVATVFQEFNLLPDRTVAENVFIGREPRRRGLVDNRMMARHTAELLDRLGIDFIDPGERVGRLTVAEQQIVEIVKALSFDARVISMDEPTASLAENEVALLYRIVDRLKAEGVAILYVSHRLKEVFDLCDEITVLKDGRLVSCDPASDLDAAELVRRMVGRSITTFFPPPLEGTEPGEVRLRVVGGGNDYLDSIDFEVKGGEILGVAGLQGSGRTELAEAIFGAQPFTRGHVEIDGSRVRLDDPRTAVDHGVALVTEDRKLQGLALNQSLLDNALLVIRSVFPGRTGEARERLPGVLTSLDVRRRHDDQEVQFLSGGNQQKVVLSKWLMSEPRVIVFDEPTRGIDVGAKISVYQLMRELAREGVAIVMISSELPELIGMADRLIVMHDGRIVSEMAADVGEEAILAAATGTLAEVGPV